MNSTPTKKSKKYLYMKWMLVGRVCGCKKSRNYTVNKKSKKNSDMRSVASAVFENVFNPIHGYFFSSMLGQRGIFLQDFFIPRRNYLLVSPAPLQSSFAHVSPILFSLSLSTNFANFTFRNFCEKCL